MVSKNGRRRTILTVIALAAVAAFSGFALVATGIHQMGDPTNPSVMPQSQQGTPTPTPTPHAIIFTPGAPTSGPTPTLPPTETPTPFPTPTVTNTPGPTSTPWNPQTPLPTWDPNVPTPTLWTPPTAPPTAQPTATTSPTSTPNPQCVGRANLTGGGVSIDHNTNVSIGLTVQDPTTLISVSWQTVNGGSVVTADYTGATVRTPASGSGVMFAFAFVVFSDGTTCNYSSGSIKFPVPPPPGTPATATPVPTPAPLPPGGGSGYVCNTPWGTFPGPCPPP